MLYILGDMGWSTIGIVWYQLGPGVGTQKVGGDGECMGWSGVWIEVVDGVGNGTLAGSTCMGKGGCITGGMGTGAGAGATGGRAGAGAGAGGVGGVWKRKFEGPGS